MHRTRDGIPASSGIVIGPAWVLRMDAPLVPHGTMLAPENAEAEAVTDVRLAEPVTQQVVEAEVQVPDVDEAGLVLVGVAGDARGGAVAVAARRDSARAHPSEPAGIPIHAGARRDGGAR